MFKRSKSPEQTALEEQLADVHAEMKGYEVTSDEYEKCSIRLRELHGLLSNYKRELVSPNAVITTLGSLAGIVTIVNYERAHVFTSAAKNFVMKPR